MDFAEGMTIQADACELMGSPLYADLTRAVLTDWRAGGPSVEVLGDWVDAPGPAAVGLRLLGSVHRLVLERRAGELATFYPSVGGTWEKEAGCAAFLALLAEQGEVVREWLVRPPQTNEPGRSAALVGALLHLPPALRLPLRLVEIGASGGLNLNATRYAYVGADGVRHGTADAALTLEHAWSDGEHLEPWPGLHTAEAVGCDPDPVDTGTAEGRLALSAYCWPDQTLRWERLRGALDVAAEHPPRVVRSGAGEFLAGIEPTEGVLTVLWHSVMWQYLSAEEQAEVSAHVDRLMAAATSDAPVAHVAAEPRRRTPDSDHEFLVTLRTSSTPEETLVLGTMAPHGVPCHWETAP